MEVVLLLAFALGMFLTQRSLAFNSGGAEIDVSSELLLVVVLGAVALMGGLMGYVYFIY